LILSDDEEADTVGPTTIFLGVYLRLVGDRGNQTIYGHWSIEDHTFTHGLLAHEVAEDTRI